MALEDTGFNIKWRHGFGAGVEKDGDVFYDSETGNVVVKVNDKSFYEYLKPNASPGGQSNSLKITNAIKENEELVKLLKSNGVTPGFVSDGGEKGRLDEIRSSAIEKTFETGDKDKYFLDQGMAAQYPIDAVYGKSIADENSQDHLVISQYRYKSPRAGEIWGENRKSPGYLITRGIGRGSALKQFLGLVRLPMPNNVQDSNNVRWGEDTMNALEAAMLSAIGDPTDELVGGGAVALATKLFGGSAKEGFAGAVGTAKLAQIITSANQKEGGFGNAGSILGPEAVARVLATQGIETSAASILARRDGVIPNSNLELLFSAPMLRQFSFMYKMSPRSREEASIVNQILRFFKQGMSARKQTANAGAAEGTSYFLGTPNVFRLQYRTDGNDAIKGLNRIKTCALTQTSVNYTPEGAFASYEKGQPVSIILTLGFQELEPIYDTDYKFRGGTKDTRFNDDRSEEGYRWAIDEKEVGY